MVRILKGKVAILSTLVVIDTSFIEGAYPNFIFRLPSTLTFR